MNGQQLTNSSNSANGTPSSSYPGSISSQSSRDASPATRTRKPYHPEPYNHMVTSTPGVSNHWPPQPSDSPLVTAQQDMPDLKMSSVSSNFNQASNPASSQPTYKYPPPTSLPPSSTAQTINNTQESVNNTFRTLNPQSHNTQAPELSRPTQSLPHQNQFQINPISNDYHSHAKPVPSVDTSFQQTPNKFQHSPQQLSQQSSQTRQPISQISQQPNQLSQGSQQPLQPARIQNQFTQQPNPSSLQNQFNQIPQRANQPSPLQNQLPQSIKQPNQMPPHQNQLFQSQQQIQPPNLQNQPSQILQHPNQPPHLQNQFPPGLKQQSQQTPPPLQNQQPKQPPLLQNQFNVNQQPNQSPQFQNQSFQQPPLQKPLPINSQPSQTPPLLNQFSQPPKQYNLLPGQTPPPNTFPPQNNTMPPPIQAVQPPSQPNQLSQNRYPQYPNQFQATNQSTPPLPNQSVTNQFPQPAQPMQNKYPQHQAQATNYQNHTPQTPNQVNYQNQYVNSNYPQPPQMGNQFNKRYPQMAGPADGLASNMAGLSVNQGFNRLWGMDAVDLIKCREILPKEKIEPPSIRLQHELYEAANCSPDIFRCTLTKIPETKSLLDKSRLPLGVLIHPFKDLNQLSVIQCAVIVRCRMCRTYINPFVYFVDNKRWKCNLCFRVNELPDEFQFDPMTKTYGDPSRRPEIKSATIEFIAPSEYMVRPPQPAVYVFVLDVSRLACESGYLDAVCRTLLAELDSLPGDARASIAFITFDSAVHFYSLTEGQGQPREMTVVDIDDIFLPSPDNLLVNLTDCKELIRDLLEKLPEKYVESYDTHSALGAALQAAYKLLAPTGGRVTVFQACLPNAGPGALTPREDPAQRAGDNPPHLNPATDFYKKLALDCSGQQIAVDLFLVNSQYVDLATISGVSRFSGGCMFHIPLYRSDKPHLVETLERSFQRYLTRKIGFESVMRIRCTRGLSIHTFHGNFFVRSTDLLSLPNANPDAGFGMQVTIDENLSDVQNVCFQAALLYTSSKGERRIRVHTLCLPVASNLADILHSADQQAIVGLLSKMAVDRAVQSSLSDAREAFYNVVGDVLSAYKLTQSSNTTGLLLAPHTLSLLPLYILALLKHVAFRVGQSTRLDDRVFAMCQMKTLPLHSLMQSVYPDLYPLKDIELLMDSEVPRVPRLQLSAERIDSLGMFLMDDGCTLLLYVGHNLPPHLCQAVFDVPHFSAIPPELYSLPELENPTSEAIRNFVSYLQSEKPYPIPLQVIRDDSHHRLRFLERLIEDKNESGTAYYEFLQRVKSLLT